MDEALVERSMVMLNDCINKCICIDVVCDEGVIWFLENIFVVVVVVIVTIAPHFVPPFVIHTGSPTQFVVGTTVSGECVTNIPRHQILGTESATFPPIIVFIKIIVVCLLVFDKVYTGNTNRQIQMPYRNAGGALERQQISVVT